jgi:hypothetical protein
MFRNPLLGATLMVIALAVMLTWPQALHLGTAVPDHDDPYFSMWRLAWIAHVLPGDARHLFDGNIFYPHLRTLAFSDATLLEGLIGAPFLWAHVNLVLVYNLLLLAGIVSSGVGMFVLVRHLTHDADAALVSAAIFTLAPYRIEHFMHLELQWTIWMPLTLWAVHRVFEKASMRFGVWAGLLLSLQLISCVYYGVFLGMIVAVFIVLLAASQPRLARAALVPLFVGGLVTVAVAAIYGIPYIENARVVGTRDPRETVRFSAQIASYLAAPEQNWLWGWTAFQFEGNELRLFPGAVAVLLAVLAVLSKARRRFVCIYLAFTVLAIELSLGLNGTVYRWLYAYAWPLQGFRAPARFGILAVCGLAVLAGVGFEYVKRRMAAPRVLLITVLVAIGLESGSAPLRLIEVPRREPDVYTFLKTSPATNTGSVVIEFPIEAGFNPLYMFWSTRHWRPLVNGYSGFTPRDYEETVTRLRTFPDKASIARLAELHVRYILVHEYYYTHSERTALLLAIARSPDLISVGEYRDWIGMTYVFEMKAAALPHLAASHRDVLVAP